MFIFSGPGPSKLGPFEARLEHASNITIGVVILHNQHYFVESFLKIGDLSGSEVPAEIDWRPVSYGIVNGN